MRFRNAFLMFLGLLLFAAAAGTVPKPDPKIRAFSASIREEGAGNIKGAISPLLEIRDDFKNDYLVHLRLGWLYYSAKEYETSVKYYKDAVRLSDNSPEALLGITLPYAALSKWELVQDAYKMILSKDNANYTANLRLGQIYFNSANYLLAKKYLESVYEYYPADYEVNLYLGWTYYNLGSRSKALQAFVNAMSVYPADTSAVKGYGLTK